MIRLSRGASPEVALQKALRQTPTAPVKLPIYLKTELPGASQYPGAMIYVSNEAGGAVAAFSDGTNWRRCTDRAVVS